jgi:glycosyltransferase 2 family protein
MSKRLRLIVGLGTLGALVYFAASGPEYLHALTNLSWQVLAVTYVVVTVGRIVMAWKWNLLLAIPTQALPLGRAIQIYCSSQVYGLALPATVGGDAVRIGFTAMEGRPATAVTASVVMERMLGVLVTLLVGILAMLSAGFHAGREPAEGVALGIVAVLLAATTFAALASVNQRLFHLLHDRMLGRFAANRVAGMVRRLHDAYLMFRGRPRVLLTFSAATGLEVLLHGLLLYLLIVGLGSRVDFDFLLAALIAASLLGRLPISVAGLGVFEAGFVYVLALAGVPPETSLLTAILSRIVQLAVWLPWWAAYLASRPEAARIRERVAGPTDKG